VNIWVKEKLARRIALGFSVLSVLPFLDYLDSKSESSDAYSINDTEILCFLPICIIGIYLLLSASLRIRKDIVDQISIEPDIQRVDDNLPKLISVNQAAVILISYLIATTGSATAITLIAGYDVWWGNGLAEYGIKLEENSSFDYYNDTFTLEEGNTWNYSLNYDDGEIPDMWALGAIGITMSFEISDEFDCEDISLSMNLTSKKMNALFRHTQASCDESDSVWDAFFQIESIAGMGMSETAFILQHSRDLTYNEDYYVSHILYPSEVEELRMPQNNSANIDLSVHFEENGGSTQQEVEISYEITLGAFNIDIVNE